MAILNGLGPINGVNGLASNMAGRMNETNVEPEFRFVSSPVVSLQDFAVRRESAPLAEVRAYDPMFANVVVDRLASAFLCTTNGGH